MADNFDTLFPGFLSGSMDITVVDKDGTPNRVLQSDLSCDVNVDWHILGPGGSSLMGDWHVTTSVEALGAGPEVKIAPTKIVNLATVQGDSTFTDRHYRTTISVVPNTIPGYVDGVYKIVTLITYTDFFNVPGAMAAFAENPIVTFYTP